MLPKFLAGRVEAWRQEACLFNADSAVVGSARRALPVGAVDAYTLLASLGGRRLTARGPYIHYTEDACILSTVTKLLLNHKEKKNKISRVKKTKGRDLRIRTRRDNEAYTRQGRCGGVSVKSVCT